MMSQTVQPNNMPSRDELVQIWHPKLLAGLPGHDREITTFLSDNDKGFQHSFEVLIGARRLSSRLVEHDPSVQSLDIEAIDDLAVFHDIGKFFQKEVSFDNLRVSQQLYREYAERMRVSTSTAEKVLDGIPATDFYCRRLNPNETLPLFIEGDIVRASDKMLDNLVRKVDRYWYEYGVPRGATFFDPTLDAKGRYQFNFGNFSGDQLNVILTIIALRGADFTHPFLGKVYDEWSQPHKDAVVNRILSLAEEVDPSHLDEIAKTIEWYRDEFKC